MMAAPTFSHGDPDYLTDTQLTQLLKAINAIRVAKDPKGNSHVEAYEIRAHLNRIFGPARWSADVLDQHLVYETSTEADKPRWSVCWYARLRLEIRSVSGAVLCSYTEGATGDATNQPSRADANDQACKTAASQALKRCAMNLGDQFGLGLYNKGSLRPLVQRTLIWEPTGEALADQRPGPDAHITAPLAPESGQPEGESQRETTSPPVSKAPPTLAPAAGGGEPVAVPAPAAGGEEESTLPPEPTEEEYRAHLGDDAAGADRAPGPADIAEPGTVHVFAAPDGTVAFFNDLAPSGTEAAEDPTAPDAAGGSPAVSEESASSPAEPVDPAEPAATPAAESASSSDAPSPDAADPDPTPGNGSDSTAEDSGVEDPIDAWERIVATVSVIRMSSPEDALQILNGLMETAVLHRLTARRYPETDKSLSVVLTEHMRDARAAVERRRAAAAAGAS